MQTQVSIQESPGLVITDMELWHAGQVYQQRARTIVLFTMYKEEKVKKSLLKLIGHRNLSKIRDIMNSVPGTILISPEFFFGKTNFSRIYMFNLIIQLIPRMSERSLKSLVCKYYGVDEIILEVLHDDDATLPFVTLDQARFKDNLLISQAHMNNVRDRFHLMRQDSRLDLSIVYHIHRFNSLICGAAISNESEVEITNIPEVTSEFINDELYRSLSQIVVKPVIVTHSIKNGMIKQGYGYFSDAFKQLKTLINSYSDFKMRKVENEYNEECYVSIEKRSVVSMLALYGKHIPTCKWIKSIYVHDIDRVVAFKEDRCLTMVFGMDRVYLYHQINIMRLTKEVKLLVGNDEEYYSDELEDSFLKLMLSDVFTTDEVSCGAYLDHHNDLPSAINDIISSYL